MSETTDTLPIDEHKPDVNRLIAERREKLKALRGQGIAYSASPAMMTAAFAEPGPTVLHVRTEPGNAPDIPLLLVDPVVLADRFRRWLTARMAGRTDSPERWADEVGEVGQ